MPSSASLETGELWSASDVQPVYGAKKAGMYGSDSGVGLRRAGKVFKLSLRSYLCNRRLRRIGASGPFMVTRSMSRRRRKYQKSPCPRSYLWIISTAPMINLLYGEMGETTTQSATAARQYTTTPRRVHPNLWKTSRRQYLPNRSTCVQHLSPRGVHAPPSMPPRTAGRL